MTRKYGERAASLRKVFEAAPEEEMTHQVLFERMGVASVGQADERTNIRNALPALVRCGYVLKKGLGPDATYRHSGKVKRPKAAAPRVRQRSALDRASRLVRTRAARVELQAANTPVPAKPKAVESGETVEQFEARGGRVEVLPTFWGRAAA
ncbi:hypothetical protein [uncultured Stenotrophomonas sp.]|uniref:hypothetical protein n=1 Tax=uncultured Stenotrophomonas sp. TaxID=165438 RepID=UPI0028E35D3C|nr:hypothetical protein [uncultured Stenotrophomonas sp.]